MDTHLPKKKTLVSIDTELQQAELHKEQGNWIELEGICCTLQNEFVDFVLPRVLHVSNALQDINQQNDSIQVFSTYSVILRYYSESFWRRGYNDKALPLANESIAYAEKSTELTVLSLALINAGILYNIISKYAQAIKYLTRANSIAEQQGDLACSARALGNLGNIYQRQSNLDVALQYYTQALKMNSKIGRVEGIGIMKLNIGLIYIMQNRFAEAAECFQFSLSIGISLCNNDLIAKSLHNIGTVCLETGDYTRALQFFFETLDIQKKIGAISMMAHTYNTIGTIYEKIRDLPKALEYATIALKYSTQHGLDYMIPRNYTLVAITYMGMGKYKSGLSYLKKALRISILNQDISSQADVLTNLGNLYYVLKEYDKAIQSWNEAEEYYVQSKNKKELARNYANKGIAYADNTNVYYNSTLAKKCLKKAITLNTTYNTKQQSIEPLLLLASICEKEKQWQEAVKYYRMIHLITDELKLTEVKSHIQKLHFEKQILELEDKRRKEILVADMKQRELELLVQNQKQELELTIDLLVDKNKFLNTITSDIHKLQKYVRTAGSIKIDDIISKINKNVASLETLASLDKQLYDVHADFILALKARYLDLTPTEIKIATLLNMKLTSPNISALLFLSVRTVELHRARIRRKMGLQQSDNIYSVLEKIGTMTK